MVEASSPGREGSEEEEEHDDLVTLNWLHVYYNNN
jgi:hypothetical protein